jgi:hypothetical protein
MGSGGGLLAVILSTVTGVVLVYIVLSHGNQTGSVIGGAAKGYETFARGLQP